MSSLDPYIEDVESWFCDLLGNAENDAAWALFAGLLVGVRWFAVE